MLKRISTSLYPISSRWLTYSAVLVFFLFVILVLPAQAARGPAIPDTSFWYTPAYLDELAAQYGPEGRLEYARSHFTFDLAWPVVYTLFLVTATSRLFARFTPSESPWRLANLAPLLAALLDLLENASTSLVMLRYPTPLPAVAALAPVFTSLKWIVIGLSICLLLAGLAGALWRWARREKG